MALEIKMDEKEDSIPLIRTPDLLQQTDDIVEHIILFCGVGEFVALSRTAKNLAQLLKPDGEFTKRYWGMVIVAITRHVMVDPEWSKRKQGDGWMLSPTPGVPFPTHHAKAVARRDNQVDHLLKQNASVIRRWGIMMFRILRATPDNPTTIKDKNVGELKGNALIPHGKHGRWEGILKRRQIIHQDTGVVPARQAKLLWGFTEDQLECVPSLYGDDFVGFEGAFTDEEFFLRDDLLEFRKDEPFMHEAGDFKISKADYEAAKKIPECPYIAYFKDDKKSEYKVTHSPPPKPTTDYEQSEDKEEDKESSPTDDEKSEDKMESKESATPSEKRQRVDSPSSMSASGLGLKFSNIKITFDS